MLRIKRFLKSFHFACRGLVYTWQQEQNFRVQSVAACIVIIFMIVFRTNTAESVALIGVIALVLILELVNTVFEKMVDILKPRMFHYVGIIKDMMASAVLLASAAAIGVGILIFYPYIRDLLFY